MTRFAPVDWNLRECFRALAAARPESDVLRHSGIHIVSLGVRFQMFNAVFLDGAVENESDFDRRLLAAEVHFGARGIRWSFWLCDEWLPRALVRRAATVCNRRGLTLATQMPGMIASVMEPPHRLLPPIEVREVLHPNELEDFRLVGAQCFRVPNHWFAEVFDEDTPDRRPFRAWVGYAHGRPISTIATVEVPGSLGIYNVATLPEHRSCGYAEAVMRAVVADHSSPLVLQSTHAGLGLYQRLGFQSVAQFRVWISG